MPRFDSQKIIAWAIAALLVACVIALLITGIHSARADGMEVSAKDGGYIDAYSTRTSRGGWTCPPEFNRRECRRIQAEVEVRRAREVRYQRSRYAEQPTPRPLRAVDDDRARRSFGGKRCAGFFSVKGDARPFEHYARGSALKEWRKRVRVEAGESYIDESYALNFRVGKCQITGDRGINKRCIAEGTACRP